MLIARLFKSICDNKKTSLLLLTVLIWPVTRVAAQQQGFSYTQYMNNMTPLNPAYSVIDKSGSLNAILRKQINSFKGAPVSYFFNGSIPLESIDGAAGLTVLNQQFAIENLTEVNAFFAKSIQLNDEYYMAVSLNAGIRRYVASYTSLDALNDPQFGNDVRETQPNIGFGVMIYTDHYYFGLAVPELTTRALGQAGQQDNSYFRSHYNFTAAYLTGQDQDDLRAKFASLAAYTRGVPFVADFSATMFLKETIGLGINYRTNTEMAGILSASFETFRVGYSYQFSANTNTVANGIRSNTNEFTVSFRFGSHTADRSLL